MPRKIKRGVAQESKKPPVIVNHFDEFCRFVRAQDWSQDFGTEIILKFMAGQRDAYDRGELHAKSFAATKLKNLAK